MNKGTKITLAVAIASVAGVLIFWKRKEITYVVKKAVDKTVKVVTEIVLDAQTEAYLDTLHPKFRRDAEKFIKEARKEGHYVYITSAFRSFKKQNALNKAGKTGAKGGQSYHNYGLAMDINSSRPTINMKSDKATWAPIVKIARKYGFTWGGDFSTGYDPVHFEKRYGLHHTKLLAMKNAGDVTDGFVNLG